MKATTLPLLAWALLGVGCASTGATLTTLKSTYEEFEQRIRWADDVGAAAQMVVAERRGAFIAARTRDAKDVSISEIELLDVHQSEDGEKATVTSRFRWVRLPSTSEKIEEVKSLWVARGGDWFLESMEGGPFPDLAPRK
jgi:hypothetical protein